ncbi:hypothetical protein NE237_019745 [Protea cynaroides]|uniref:Pentatricopeptide repeat-containing protein n=1 Tax=Protea cynaroides TaxID=273540 RepID=A0A9Q0H5X8_9MAGN|nr:hypothetical protein NE237_019745 [Protea cynaroides]
MATNLYSHEVEVLCKPNLNKDVLTLLNKCNHLDHLKQLQAFLLTPGHGQTLFYAFKLVRFCALTLTNLNYAPKCLPLYGIDYVLRLQIRSEIGTSLVPEYDPEPKSINAQIFKLGFGGYPIVKTAPLDSYSRSCSDDRNVVSWTAIISGYTWLGQIGNAVLLFEEMPERDVPSWNAVIARCTQNGLLTEAISLFRRMVVLADRDVRPNQVTVVCLPCKWIHGYIYGNSLGPNSFVVSNVIFDMYGKCRKDVGYGGVVKPDGITFVGLLNACTHGGLIEKGCDYFGCVIDLLGRASCIEEAMEDVKGMRIEPDEFVWCSLLNGCKIHGHMDLAEFGVMLANIYGDSRNWEEVNKVRKTLKEKGVKKTPGCS